MEGKKLREILSQFMSYKNQAEIIINKVWSLEDVRSQAIVSMPQTSIKTATIRDMEIRINKLKKTSEQLIKSYNSNYYDIAKMADVNLKYIQFDNMESALNILITECDKVIGALQGEESALTSMEQKKQEELRKEVAETCKNLDPLYEENLNEALDELEGGHFLASALITSRVVDYTLKQLKIQEDKQEIKKLIKTVTDEKSNTILKQQTETISRLSRNLYNHRIDRFAKFSQASSLLSDCLFLLDVYSKSRKQNGEMNDK